MTTGLLDVGERVWPVLLFLALIQVVADLCDEAGLFDVSAHVAARLARGSRIGLFLLFVALATVCTWVLSIDTTAVLLAPIGLALAAELGLSALPFAFAAIWLANAGSLLLPVSNLTNLLAQSHLGLGAVGFVREMWLPQLAVLVVVIGVLLLRHRRALRGAYEVPRTLPAYDPVLLWLSVSVVVLIGPAVVLGVPAWLVSLVAVVALVIGFLARRPDAVRPRRLLGLVPWTVVGFAIALFALVEVVVEEGSSVLTTLFGTGESGAALAQLGCRDLGAGQRDQQPADLPRRRAVRPVHRPPGDDPRRRQRRADDPGLGLAGEPALAALVPGPRAADLDGPVRPRGAARRTTGRRRRHRRGGPHLG